MKKIVAILFFQISTILAYCQNTIGIPDIINYTKSHYNAGPSSWDAVQDNNGIMYFANSEGILSFDGAYWKTYPLPNNAMGRSIALGKDNKIYTGSQDDFGYFSPNATGHLVYTSLKPLLPEKHRSITGVWDIIVPGNDIFFKTESRIFQLNNGSLTVYPAVTEWRFLGYGNNQVIAQDTRNGLLKFTNGVWAPFVKENELPEDFLVTAIVNIGKDSALVSTIRDGLFILSNNKITRFRYSGVNPFVNELILSCTPVNSDWIAIGTQLNGCYIINKKGEIIQNISRKEGLQSNCVLQLYLDKNQNLWMALDNGVDFTAYNNAIKHIYPEQLNEGAGYSSIIYKNELYIGTSNRLYKIPVTENKKDLSFLTGSFEPLPDTRGSVWGLFDINGQLLVAHHEGAYRIHNGAVLPINDYKGYFLFMPFFNVLPSSLIVAGSYSGLDFLQYQNNTFSLQYTLPDLKEAFRFVAIDNNNTIWISHTFKGVYKIDVSDNRHPKIKLYNDKNGGLPSPIKNHLFKVKNRIVVATEKGIYEYNARTDAFESSAYFKSFFGNRSIRHLKEDAAGNIWFVEEKSLGVVDVSGTQAEIIYFPELTGRLVSNFENINPIDNMNVLVGADKGFYHINYEQYKRNRSQIKVKIGSVKAFGKSDSLLFGGYLGEINKPGAQPKETISAIGYNWNSLHFEYSSPLNAHQSSVEFSYYLKGFDKDWSAWSKKTERDYTNLPAGTYTFQVKAKSNLGNESAISSYTFNVLPPWYKTAWAYFVYFLMSMGVVYLIYMRQRKKFLHQQQKHEEEQKRLQYLHQLELEKSEKEIVTLKNEKLQAEIEHKNTELASVAMHLVQKGELLAKIKEELVRIKKVSNGDAQNNGDFKKVLHILGEEDKMDKDWEHFAIHFDKVHSDFLRTLKASYPNLSAHELKLSAYLLMNLSSKEIAQLMNISVRGVEISRYRLRKKFRLSTETNLFNFLLEFSARPVPSKNGNGNGHYVHEGNGVDH